MWLDYLLHISLRTNRGINVSIAVHFFLILLITPYAQAQAPTKYSSADVVTALEINITSFRVVGENPLKAKLTNAVLNPYIGPKKNIGDIETAVNQLEERLRKEGYSFYRVSISSQELIDGEIELSIQRYRIGKITVTGNRYYSNENILASLPQLKEGASPNTMAMSRSLRVANQNSGKRTQLQLESSLTPNNLDATVQVVDQKPLVLSTWINNTGTDLSGRYRVGISVEHRNVLNRDHTANFSFVSSPESFNAVQQYALTYKVPLYKLGGKFNAFAVKSDIDTGTVADVFDVAGRGEVLGIGYTQILPTFGKYRHQISAQLTDKLFENDILFAGQQIGPDVRSRPLSLSYQSNWQTKNLNLGWSLALTKNLSGGKFNDSQSYSLSRSGADSDWQTYTTGLSIQYHRKKWLFTGNVRYSGSSDRLITGEQFSLGGASSIRGMEERELRGDKGYQLSLQAWTPALKEHLRPVLFLDIGKTSINKPDVDELTNETVASLGASLHWTPSPRINASISFAHLLDGIDAPRAINSDLSQDGDSKLHFNLVYRY